MHRLAVNLAVRKFKRGAAEERLKNYTSTTFAMRFIVIVSTLALCTSVTVWQSASVLELVASSPAISVRMPKIRPFMMVLTMLPRPSATAPAVSRLRTQLTGVVS